MSELAKDIVANDVSMAFTRGSEKLVVLDSVSLEVLRGSFLSIVGPSGCGKTTLLRILAQLLTPTSGEVWIESTVTKLRKAWHTFLNPHSCFRGELYYKTRHLDWS
jgi:ABC-type sugar transport system ATPase subunit